MTQNANPGDGADRKRNRPSASAAPRIDMSGDCEYWESARDGSRATPRARRRDPPRRRRRRERLVRGLPRAPIRLARASTPASRRSRARPPPFCWDSDGYRPWRGSREHSRSLVFARPRSNRRRRASSRLATNGRRATPRRRGRSRRARERCVGDGSLGVSARARFHDRAARRSPNRKFAPLSRSVRSCPRISLHQSRARARRARAIGAHSNLTARGPTSSRQFSATVPAQCLPRSIVGIGAPPRGAAVYRSARLLRRAGSQQWFGRYAQQSAAPPTPTPTAGRSNPLPRTPCAPRP